jgi:hypothetical protein
MRIGLTSKKRPYLLYYTDALPEGTAGAAKGFVIRIRPGYKDDMGILYHEMEHVDQFWLGGLIIHMRRYTGDEEYRLSCEVNAYRIQLIHPPANGADKYRLIYAGRISRDYGLSITEAAAYSKLLS